MTNKKQSGRLIGLDLARFIAFVGMVIVNFKIVMGAEGEGAGLLGLFTGSLEGRAAATFVVLAGIGLGLAAMRTDHRSNVIVTLKRAAFLLVIGLLNSLIFEADILHYYAFYFLFGVFFLPLSTRALIWSVAVVNIIFIALIFVLDYNTGWNWTDFTYSDFWTTSGFIRNLFFNGWHPVFPWLSFLLFGMILARLNLAEKSVQTRMIVFGAAGIVIAELLSLLLIILLANGDADLTALLGSEPIPPMPIYMAVGMSVATLVTGICLRISPLLDKSGLLKFITPAGRQTLTLYIAHIFIGMGTLEAMGMLGGQSLQTAFIAALVFSAISLLYSFAWSKYFKRGPAEALMRKIAG